MNFKENVLPETGFSAYNLFNYNKTIINTKIGKLYIYCSSGWNAKKYETGKELYNMQTILQNQEINSFCFWLNSIIS